MKKVITLLALVLLSINLNAQTYEFYQTDNVHNKLRLNTKTGEIYQIQDDGLKFLVFSALTPENQKSGRYELIKTENMWTYILLDTWYGWLMQCQYKVDSDSMRGCLEINSEILSTTEKSKFTVEPLVSMFQFYLINEENGEMWKFQWSTKGDDYRWIERF